MPYLDEDGEFDCGHGDESFCDECGGCHECSNCYCEDDTEDDMYTLGLEPRGRTCS